MYMLEFYNKSIFVFQKQIQHHTVSFQVILCWFVYSFVSFIRYVDLLLFNFKLAVCQLYSSLAQGFISNTRNYGITCNLLTWFETIFQERCKKGANSNWREINTGVSQGSILDSLMFIIFRQLFD